MNTSLQIEQMNGKHSKMYQCELCIHIFDNHYSDVSSVTKYGT